MGLEPEQVNCPVVETEREEQMKPKGPVVLGEQTVPVEQAVLEALGEHQALKELEELEEPVVREEPLVLMGQVELEVQAVLVVLVVLHSSKLWSW